jgi:dinuclear metal center YbgI/SA1388 family protein
MYPSLNELDRYFRSFLAFDAFPGDPSRNGIQVQNSAPDNKPITCIAFAVDACQETIQRAGQSGAQLLFVHHGLFWGQEQILTGSQYHRISKLIHTDIALYACHLPLDAHPELGNNACLATRIGLLNPLPFGSWKNMTIGLRGELPEPVSIDRICEKLFTAGELPLTLLPFGPHQINTVAVISGGGEHEISQAISCGVDLYITGEIGHEQYHQALENGLNVIAAGHYQTETAGVMAVMHKLESDMSIKTVFIDVPTGL